MTASSAMRGRRRPVRTAGSPEASAAHSLNTIARIGFVARGVVYALIGVLALAIATGKAAPAADRTGALQFLSGQSYGKVLLWILTIGFAAMALWRFAQVYFAIRRHSSQHSDEIQSFVRGVAYTTFFFGALHYVQQARLPQTTDQQSKDFTAQAMAHSGGRIAVIVVGVVILAVGLYMVWSGITARFFKELKGGMTRQTRKVVKFLGTVGNIARGAMFGGIGVFMIDAAARFKPGDAKGTDAVLRSFADQPFGRVLLIAVAIGLVLFGMYSWCEARWHRDL